MAFENILQFTRKAEGGPTDNPDDPGGLTGAGGLTQTTYDAWLITKGRPTRNVDDCDAQDYHDCAYDTFWIGTRCDRIAQFNVLLAEAVFDFAFNAGPGDAIEVLQAIFGLLEDGKYGELTNAALAKAGANNPAATVRAYLFARLGWYVGRNQPRFRNGWENRVFALGDFLGVSIKSFFVG
jgi:lysozyme family protein